MLARGADRPGELPLPPIDLSKASLAATPGGKDSPNCARLIVRGNLEREGFFMLERRTAVEPQTGDAGDCEFDRYPVGVSTRAIILWMAHSASSTDEARRRRFRVAQFKSP